MVVNIKTYGSVEFYSEHFSDILADADCKDARYGDNMIQGFLLALDEWMTYHKEQADEYERLKQRVREALAM